MGLGGETSHTLLAGTRTVTAAREKAGRSPDNKRRVTV